ncbi:kynureninase [Hyphobacterium sp. SN044]|uniref:kynureninase n=1 Tax=Hyphobacterium sp. SN044 TaxID=2912575 RepID=UPI001F02BB8F|nr:kynureninase [Hyphobacterium sp. SN044]MCF8879015.1 kynureninase [Hyphobacterium sp. SN044]
MTDLTLDSVREMDREDTLANFRDRFDIPEGLVYLDGNSLGCLPKATPDRIETVLREEWGRDLIRSWNSADWINAPRRVGTKIAKLIGANDDEVVAADSTSINVFKALSACLQLNPKRTILLSERGNFPTDVYMMQGLSVLSGGRIETCLVDGEDIIGALDESVAALLLTHVHYKTGRMRDMKAVTAAAHEKGVPVIWDLSHSAGAVPVDLKGANADFAVGCGYKYLNGGPGAPAFIFAARRHQDAVFPALSGWLGHAAPFEFDDTYRPAPGIDRFQCGTPGILGMAALESGLDVMLETRMTDLRAKSSALGDLFIALMNERCAQHGFTLACPKQAEERGSQVSFHHKEGYAIMQAVIARGVIGDFRAPDILRFGFAPLYNSYEDVWRAVGAIRTVMESGEWRNEKYAQRAAVT